MKRLYRAAVLSFLVMSIAAGAFAQQTEKPAEKDLVNIDKPVNIDKDGKIIVAPELLQSSDLVLLLLQIRISEGRASKDQNGKIVISPRYPMDCQIYFHILNLPKMNGAETK